MRKVGVLAVLCVIVLSACRVDASVVVRVREDGSGVVRGTVRLDSEAVKAVEVGGAKLETAVRLEDLKSAGWRASAWVRKRDGGAVLTVSKGFARVEDAGAVVAELNGPDGPLRDVRVTRESSTFSTEWSFAGVADMKDLKTGIASDTELVDRLVTERVDGPGLDQRLLAQTRDAFRLRVTAELPNASPKVYPVRPGTTVVMRTSSSDTATSRVAMLAAGLAIGVVAIGLVVVGELRSRRRRRA